MKRITLRVKHAPLLRIDARTLLPSTLAALTADEIERRPLWHGNGTHRARGPVRRAHGRRFESG